MNTSAKLPRQIPYIIGNEACERFSFYGMRNILVPFLISSILLAYLPEGDRSGAAKDIFHTFVIGVYFFQLLGGWLSDRYFGKYNTVLWLSLVYVAGHACLALFEDNRTGFYTGLFLIALGSGGIKPLVSAFVGDQFDQTNKSLAKIVYDAFYWTINFGSFFASLLMPIFLREYGPSIAFGIPGLLMAVATLIFWAGRHKYVHVPPAPAARCAARAGTSADSVAPGGTTGLALAVVGIVLAVVSLGWLWFGMGDFVIAVLVALGLVIGFGSWGASLQLDRARGAHPDAAVDGARAVLRILIVFALVTPFWSLFDQKASTWIIQGREMTMPHDQWWWPSWLVREPAQMQALNPILVMLLIPFNNIVLFPLVRRMGIEVTALRRMGVGIAFSGMAWIVAGWLQLSLDGGDAVSIAWQILPYLLLTLGEVLVSATGLEFAYSQAPRSMKGVIMSFWLLSVSYGNLWVLITNEAVRNEAVTGQIATTGLSETAFLMFFFAVFAFVAALVFAWYARRYPMQDNYRAAA